MEASVKCLVWDLDNTLWNGTLLEDDAVALREGVVPILEELDRRGILCSVASKNDYKLAHKRLEELNVRHYFLVPQINWNPKSDSVRVIAESLNLGTDTVAFVDDERFEREEVAHVFPEVLCLDSKELGLLLALPRFNPRFVTTESSQRRQLYRTDIQRKQKQNEFSGNNEAFLATLGMVFEIRRADQADLQRAEELTERTHQLNSTGYTYSYEELDAFRTSTEHLLLVVRVEDRFGPYGTVGLCLVHLKQEYWTIRLLLVSCRVMSRGVGTVLMNRVMTLASDAGVLLRAEFLPTDRNRPMYITYRLSGFKEIDKRGELLFLEHSLDQIQPLPDYVVVRTP